jgi:hypothetical protein
MHEIVLRQAPRLKVPQTECQQLREHLRLFSRHKPNTNGMKMVENTCADTRGKECSKIEEIVCVYECVKTGG